MQYKNKCCINSAKCVVTYSEILFTGGGGGGACICGKGGDVLTKKLNHTITTTYYTMYLYIYTHHKGYTLFVANLQKKNVLLFPILLTFYCVKCETTGFLILNSYMNSI